MLYDLVNEVLSVNALAPASYTSASAGSAIDLTNCEVSTNAILDVGAVSGTTPVFSVQVEESADGATGWSAIPGMVFTNVTAGTVHQVVRGLRTHRYVRANIATVTGTSPTALVSVEIIAQKKYSGGNPGGYSRAPST